MAPVDNLVEHREWGAAPLLVVTAWVAAAAAVAWCVALGVAGSDPAGLLIVGLAGAGLIVAALFGTRARPRLRADADGLTVRGLVGRSHHPWPLVREVRVLRMRRLGITGSLLEIDTLTVDGDERLLVLGRLELGAEPEDVAAAVLAARPGSPGRRSAR
jgi:hypothetical protein